MITACATVYNEKFMKGNGDSIHFQNLQLYTFGLIFGAIAVGNVYGTQVFDFRVCGQHSPIGCRANTTKAQSVRRRLASAGFCVANIRLPTAKTAAQTACEELPWKKTAEKCNWLLGALWILTVHCLLVGVTCYLHRV
ncbi:hypothetical protein CYMTET_7391 [Cymbomonas tetramitiformis]|uniref:Uncharacterized protein n=1 Tax=Cymbomonas tetramitiformis TaxID=36881 RepID=A0AAE0LH44_9CHLO|nr:hypothetical protein CYMTET_7391 [Cymbomonas tetramitiformis]